MSDRMRARGPDDGGVLTEGAWGFGHRRLKVMDLSDGSAQPMSSAQLGLSIVFNGAIYNYPELREDLRTRGYSFSSDGDTEVLLKAWHCWGRDSLRRLDGMFAFAIREWNSGRTTLVRDRLGIKPLYYTVTRDYLRFASSLPALVVAGGVAGEIDPMALNAYMSFHSVVPPPRTLIRNIRKLAPGHLMTIEASGTCSEECYWQLSFSRDSRDESRSFAEWREMLLDELRAAVRKRLVAAVDVGVLLSGGIDSSLLVGLMAEAGASRLATYSVGFESVGDKQGDEFVYSDIIADRFQTSHHKIRVSSSQLLAHLPDAIAAMSEPMVSHDCIGFYLLSKEVAKSSKAVQSGQGADEVFGGYHWYPPMVEAERPLDSYRDAFFDRDFLEYKQVIGGSLPATDYASDFVEQHFGAPGAEDPVDKALRLDSTVMLVEDPVKRVDNMTMAWGLEARVPFLDHRLVEFAARMPSRHKVASEGKYVLREAARRVIPPAVIDRPKGYFPVPALTYLRGEVLDYVRDALFSEKARNRGVYNRAYVDRVLEAPEKHITPLGGSKLWQLGLMEIWLQTQGV